MTHDESLARKPATRYSLNAFGRALADVMNKDTKDPSHVRAAKKPRDSIRTRTSAASVHTNSSDDRRSSIGERPLAKEDAFSPGETITRTSRRRSTLKDTVPPASLASPAKASTPLGPAAPTRRSTLRPRPLANPSALPKYPPTFSSSPGHTQTRQSRSRSRGVPMKLKPGTSVTREMATRPISPLPQRALPPSSPTKPSPHSRSSSARNIATPPNKLDRSSKPSTPTRSTIPRPPSSTSSSSSLPTPRTPTRQVTVRSGSPVKGGAPSRSPGCKQPASLMGKPSRQDGIPKIVKVDQFNRSHSASSSSSAFTEGDSADDIEFMLGSVVSPTAPTPALPRIRHQHGEIPQTPSRTLNLPTRADLSYLSPVPPSTCAPSSVRLMRAGHDRGSLLSWDQLVAVGDKTLGEGEAEKMIADIPAPFSPAASTVDLRLNIPESPSLSALPSPAGYGSISRSQFIPENSRPAAADASLVVMLRLQLASMENIAKERLTQITTLEAQLGAAKDARLREAADLAAQVSALEQQMHVSFESRERAAEERLMVEEQLRGAAAAKDLAVQEAVKQVTEDAARLRVATEEGMRRKCEVAGAARGAATSWVSVREQAEGELDFVRDQRETLTFLLATLDQNRQVCHFMSA
ncbi:hypothetical protein BGY98DRAFT_958168 [Russula aff. rugulosa BPL654]|nr:hypothetical protein BGY98DRAFT_958168 [Russula aff. rugulosa BPL654]